MPYALTAWKPPQADTYSSRSRRPQARLLARGCGGRLVVAHVQHVEEHGGSRRAEQIGYEVDPDTGRLDEAHNDERHGHRRIECASRYAADRKRTHQHSESYGQPVIRVAFGAARGGDIERGPGESEGEDEFREQCLADYRHNRRNDRVLLEGAHQ